MTVTQSPALPYIGPMSAVEKIAWLCDREGTTQARVEEIAHLSAGRISKWLAGQGEPTARQALKIARHFGVPVEWLADDAQDVPPPVQSEDERIVLAIYHDLGLSRAEAVRRLSVPVSPTIRGEPAPRHGDPVAGVQPLDGDAEDGPPSRRRGSA
jgi:transcriptional regulator with XRE-family HTH domain